MLYKYCDTKGFGILLESKLWLRRVDDFNDPFELRLGIDKDTALSTIKKEYKEHPNIIKNQSETKNFFPNLILLSK